MKKLIPLALLLPILLLLHTTGCGRKPAKTTVAGKGDAKLMLTVSEETLDLVQGKKQEFSVSIKREDFEGPINLAFTDLPKGIKVEETAKEIPKDKDQAVFTLLVSEEAELQEKTRLAVKGTNQQAGVNGTVYLTVTVKESLENRAKRQKTFAERMNARLKTITEKLHTTERDMPKADPSFKADFQKKLANINYDVDKTQKELKKLEAAAVEKWELHQDAVNSRVQNLETAVDRAAEQLQAHLKEKGKKEE